MADGDMELLEQMRRRRSGWGEEDFDRLYRRFASGRSLDPERHTVSTSIPSSPTYAPPLGGIAP
jgi:hypothetical protein